jgi:outer membrane receptor protein involved in Fe transport
MPITAIRRSYSEFARQFGHDSRRWGWLLLLFVVSGSLVYGQEAGLVGTVADPTGAVISRASITVHSQDTGVDRHSITDSEGRFSISPLPIGQYTLSSEFTGFQTTTVTGIYLSIGHIGRVEVTMQVGAISDHVEVKDSTPLLQTEQATVGTSVESRKLVELPLNGRDFTQLVSLTPGGSSGGSAYETGNSQVLISGQRSTKTTSTIDGVLNVDQLFQGFPISPNVDAIEEFRVQSGNFSADQGMGPSNVSIRLKSGTNALHGTLFEFLRNDKMAARGFFADSREDLKRNQFGGTAGGPILKDKMFFFGAYEGTRQHVATPIFAQVPTLAQRQGDFSGFNPIIDPSTGKQFVGNRIPADRINPVASYFSDFYPAPNDFIDGYGFYRNNAAAQFDRDQYNGRYDYYVNEKHRLFGTYTLNDNKRFDPATLPAQGGLDRAGRAQNAGFNWNYIITPNVMNTMTLGWARFKNTITPTALGVNHTVLSGYQGFEQTSARFPGFPSISLGGGYTGFNGYDWDPLINPTDNRQIKDDFSIVHGAHQLRMGVDLRKFVWSSQSATASRGDFAYQNNYSGDSWGDFVLGIPSYALRQYPQSNYNQTSYNYGFYAQDDWRVTRNLTINLGVRYEYDTWPVDSRNQVTSFDESLGKFAVGQKEGQLPDLQAQPLAALAWQLFGNYLVTADQAGLPNRTLRYPDKNNWAPRLGVAYQPAALKNTVIRAGYGIFYSLLNGNNYSDFAATSLPWIITQSVNNTTIPTLTNQTLFPPFDAPGAATPNLQPIVYDANSRIPYTQEWNVAIQHQFGENTSFEAAYVANKGTKLELRVPFNRPYDPGPGDIGSRRPFPDLSEGYAQRNLGNSVYHSLQVKLERRFSHGLSLLAAYAWSKSIDDASSDYGGGVLDVRNYGLERAVSDFDHPHRFTAGYLWELPFGRGRRWLSGTDRPLDLIFGGWELGGIVEFQSGDPFTVGMSGDVANVGSGYQRPNRIASGKASNPNVDSWFDPSAFATPAAYTFGDSGRNILRTDALTNWDLSLLKDFVLHENVRVQLRGEFFNVLNHPVFGTPDSDFTSNTVGRVFSQANSPRVGQVALKLVF